ncbi:hydroxymyristoyl-ACP dehydratase [Piscinibacter sakaiensis]|uniref:hydroxymyristoyl-ACP dehydratase n=1 Tax=Piscinibacter sakaiensis TaxID=1547922 RepID=UPI003AAA57B2
MASAPATLERAGILERIPHQGRMCVLDRLLGWSATEIRCSASSHRDPANPLRSASGLLAPAAIEYAAQAMALHGSLLAGSGGPPGGGHIASLRQVQFGVTTLHDVPGALLIFAERLAGDADVVAYRFEVDDEAGQRLAEGRATVVLHPPEARR